MDTDIVSDLGLYVIQTRGSSATVGKIIDVTRKKSSGFAIIADGIDITNSNKNLEDYGFLLPTPRGNCLNRALWVSYLATARCTGIDRMILNLQESIITSSDEGYYTAWAFLTDNWKEILAKNDENKVHSQARKIRDALALEYGALEHLTRETNVRNYHRMKTAQAIEKLVQGGE